MTSTFHYFRRGRTFYFHEDLNFVKRCWGRARLAISRGLPEPEEIRSINDHPSRLGFSWYLKTIYDLG